MACREPIRVRIELTPEQSKQIRIATGEIIEALEFTAEEIVQHVVPLAITGHG